jgi:hypothetical protein
MRAYRQNHILAPLPARESNGLHRVDGISQLWFDDVVSMRVAMESAEQRLLPQGTLMRSRSAS